MSTYHILLVEDEPNLLFNLEFNLKSEGYKITTATDGNQAIELYRKNRHYDLIILDVMLPGMTGFEVAEQIRKDDKHIQILMLTARAAEEDIITGLEKGADDYVTKPFSFKELLLRVNRMAKRSDLIGHHNANSESHELKESVKFGAFMFDQSTLKLISPNGDIILTDLEAKVLNELIHNSGKVLSRQYLLEAVWGVSGKIETRTVDNFIMRLRKYIEDNPAEPFYIKSIRGRGYQFTAKVTHSHSKQEQ